MHLYLPGQIGSRILNMSVSTALIGWASFCCTVSVFVEIVFISKGAAWHALIFRSTPEIQSDETMLAVPHSGAGVIEDIVWDVSNMTHLL